MDEGSLSCGYFQIKKEYYIDCGTPDKRPDQSLEDAWKQCSDNYDCAVRCVHNFFNRYKSNCNFLGQDTCQARARLHNGGPQGCILQRTVGYWNDIHKCAGIP